MTTRQEQRRKQMRQLVLIWAVACGIAQTVGGIVGWVTWDNDRT